MLPKKILMNARKPKGFWGKIFIKKMNKGHAALTAWALEKLDLQSVDLAVDIGCGGGRVVNLLARSGLVNKTVGIDYSPTSVACAGKLNRKEIQAGRVEIKQGSVSQLPFDNNSVDIAVSFESYYYWPDLEQDMLEIFRTLKPGGRFMLVAELYDNGHISKRDQEYVDTLHMTNLTPEAFSELFYHAGYREVTVTLKEENCWICVIGKK